MLYESKFTKKEVKHYIRQMIVPELRVEGQEKLMKSKVFVVGLGGLGCPLVMYLAACGIGTIGIVDYDEIELSNLHRQILFDEESVGRLKSTVVKEKLQKLNSLVKIVEHGTIFGETETILMKDYDIIIDCCDNIKTRYLINDYSRIYKKDTILGSSIRWEGQVYKLPIGGSCFRCIFPEEKVSNSTCDELGVIGPICGTIGTFLATEVIKLILGNRDTYMITYNGYDNNYKKINLRKRGECEICMNKKLIKHTKTSTVPPQRVVVDGKYKITWEQYIKNKKEYKLYDLRDQTLFDVSRIKDSINLPAKDFKTRKDEVIKSKRKPVFLCPRGVRAQKYAQEIINEGKDCYVLEGGLKSFKKTIDGSFPI
ncbi:ThiF MoeB HesA family protein [Spraguea lophii 42_110]|uniref:ThiF MoeB HesA family protein n=1 Tax=Spraguea lophii (strain 42_110) TaxID=1358809 RepID=S7XPP2_SPRLO|nr:ThiF MoeB HesA family protein [Spraguea lophii 42_110]